jgi:hypothetical protein
MPPLENQVAAARVTGGIPTLPDLAVAPSRFDLWRWARTNRLRCRRRRRNPGRPNVVVGHGRLPQRTRICLDHRRSARCYVRTNSVAVFLIGAGRFPGHIDAQLTWRRWCIAYEPKNVHVLAGDVLHVFKERISQDIAEDCRQRRPARAVRIPVDDGPGLYGDTRNQSLRNLGLYGQICPVSEGGANIAYMGFARGVGVASPSQMR